MTVRRYRVKKGITDKPRRSQRLLAKITRTTRTTTPPPPSPPSCESPAVVSYEAACPDERSRFDGARPAHETMVGCVVDTLHLRVPPELWIKIFSYLPAVEIRELRNQSRGMRDLIDTNKEAIARKVSKRALSRLGEETEEANSLPSEFTKALRKWLGKNGVCENCYSSAHYDDLAAFVWHWFSRRYPNRMPEQPKREDFNSMSTACRYIIALEVMPLEPDLEKRVELTRRYSDQLHSILLRRQDWFALQGMNEVNALLERLEDQPDPYPEDLYCGGRHIVEPMASLRRYRPIDHVPLLPLRNQAKISNFGHDADREQALQRIHKVLRIPRLMESTSATYYAPTDATWVKKVIDRIKMGEDLKLGALQRAEILEAIVVA